MVNNQLPYYVMGLVLTVMTGVAIIAGGSSSRSFDLLLDGVEGVVETSVILSSGALTITDANGGTSIDTLTLACNGSSLRISDPGNAIGAGAGTTQFNPNTVDVPIASISSILVDTLAGNDTLILNFSGGCDFIPSGGLTFNGGAPTSGPGDKLSLLGGSQGTVTYNYTNANDGNIVMTGGAVAGAINYTGLEPISNAGTATDVVFNLPAGPSNATLATVGGSTMRFSASPVTFETTTFESPSGSVSVNRGSAADTFTLSGIAGAPSLNIGTASSPFGTIAFSGSASFASNKNLTGFAAGQITCGVNAGVSTSGNGSISLTTTRNISMGPGSSLTSVDGALTLSANAAGTTAGGFTGISVGPATVQSTGTGKVTVTGKGGNSGQHGVAVASGGTIRGGSGSGVKTEVNGTGSTNSGGNSYGVFVDGSSSITSLGGDVVVTGSGGTGSGGGTSNFGVHVLGTNAFITSGGSGAVTVNGFGGSAVSNNIGVIASTGGTITSGGSGDVTINGTGGLGVFGVGVEVFRDGTITSGGGAVYVNGTSPGSDAVLMTTDVSFALITSGGGPVTITAVPGSSAIGIFLNQATGGQSKISSGSNAPITLISDSMLLNNGNTAIDAGTGTVNVRPFTSARGIDLGGPGSSTLLGLSDAELDRVTGSTINIGDGATGPVTFTAPITRAAPTVFNVSNGTGNIAVAAGTLDTANGNATFAPGGAVTATRAGVDITTGAGSTFKIAAGRTLGLSIGGTTVDSGYDQLNVVGRVDVTGVILALSAGFAPTAGNTFTIVNNDAADAIIGEFAGLPDETVMPNFLGSGFNAKIDYQGGDGNDCVITVLQNPPLVYSISGRVVNVNGRGIKNALVTVSGGSLPMPLAFLADENGLYSVGSLADGVYTLSVSQRRFTFSPPNRVITLNSNVIGADFSGSPVVP